MYKTDLCESSTPTTRLERVSRAFSAPSWWYNMRGLFLVTFVYRSTLWSQVAFFARNLSARHLEVPVGNGSVLSFVLGYHRLRRRPAPHVVGIDCSDAMLAAARRTFAKRDNVAVQHGDVAHLNFPDHSFDSVNIANGFHCFPDAAAALDEICRVLAPGGTLAVNALLHPRGMAPLRWIASRINRWAVKNGLLNSPFEADEVRQMFQSRGLQIVEDRIAGNTLYLTARKP